MRKTIRYGAVAVAIASTTLVATAGTAYPQPHPETASVTGSAEFTLPFHPDDDVRSFTFDARSKPYSRPLPFAPEGLPYDAVGTVRISHLFAADNTTITAEAAVDCLVTAPGTATLTAIVTRADEPVRDWVGKRVGFSVYDGGPERGDHSRDRVSFSWDFSIDQNGEGEWVEASVGTCVAPAAFGTVTKGGYTVHHADLVPAPTSG